MAMRQAAAASSSESDSAISSQDESDVDLESESLSDDSARSQALGGRRPGGDTKPRPLAPFKNPTSSFGSHWLSREKQFETFRSGLVTLPLPDGVQRIEKAKGYSLHVMSVHNWVLPESVLTLPSTPNQLQHSDENGDDDDSDGEDELVLTLGAHVSMFHAPSKRFFGNTWVSPELPVDPGQIQQRQTAKSSAVSYVVENALLNLRAYFISDVVDANCVGIVELVAYQKDPDSKATVKVTGCGWTILPLFSRSEKGSAAAPPLAFSMDASGQSVNVFVGSPRSLWELAPSAWSSQQVLESCKLVYQLVQYEPILSISMFLRRNELVGALDTIPGLKNGNLANIDVGRNPKMLLWEEQDATYEEALATFVKLASLVPKTIAVEESFELAVTVTRVAIHLRQKVESDLVARLKISRAAIHDGATKIDGEISARVLKVALHNGRCFRTRHHTVPLKADQAGDDALRCVNNRTRLRGFVFHPYLAVVLVLQFTVHFRLEWPAKLKQAAIDAKRPLPPEEDVVLVTIGSRAIIPSDGKKLYLYDKHHHATALAAQPMTMGGGDGSASTEAAAAPRVLHVDLLSGAPCRPYSDNTLYTPPSHAPQLFQAGAVLDDASISYCDIKIEPGEYKGPDSAVGDPVESGKAPTSKDATVSNNQLSDTEDAMKQTEGRAAERWAKKLLGKASNNALLAQVLDTLADSPPETPPPPSVTPLVLPSSTAKVSIESKPSPTKQTVPEPITLPNNCRSSELSRASKTLLARHGYMDGIDGRDVAASSPTNQEDTAGRGRTKKSMPTLAKSLEQELKDVHKANEIRFHFAALRTFSRTDRDESVPAFAATRVYFTFQFYNFAPTRTEPLRLSDAFDNGSGGESTTLLLMREKPADKPSLAIQFEVDTSATMNPLESRQFAEYLLTKSLYVDVWDADSLFLLGTFAIPLHELLRQGAGVKKFQAEMDILEPIDAGGDTVDPGTIDEGVAASRLLDVGEGFDCRGKAVVAKIQLLMSNYGLKGENRLDNIKSSKDHHSTIDAPKHVDANLSSTSKKHRVRARPLVESNPELRRLLFQEGFYRAPAEKRGDAEQSTRRQRVDGISDASSLSAKEISILCDLFRSRKSSASGQSSSRILCDREGSTGLVALMSLHAKATSTPSGSVPKTATAPAMTPAVSLEETAQPLTNAGGLDTKQQANADRLQRIMRVASTNNVALEDAFRLFDADADGFLSHAEFVRALRSLGDAFAGVSDEDLVALAASMDANKDGKVDCAEFGAFLTRNQTSQERAGVWRERIKRVIARATAKGVGVHHVFVQLDTSGDGQLSLDEFKTALTQLGVAIDADHEGLRKLLAEFDADHDGQISYHEFIQSLGISIEQNRADVIADTAKDIVARVQEVVKRLEARGVHVDDAFVHFDTDKNGSLSLAEFMEAMNQLLQSDVAAASEADSSSSGYTLKSLEQEAALVIMKSVNADGDDKIDYREFLTFCGVSRDSLGQKEAERKRAKLARAEKKLIKLIMRAIESGMKTSDVFQHFDANADGEISLAEFQRCFEQLFQGQQLEADDAQQIAAHFDRNGDGKISLHEFQSFGQEIVRNQHALLALFKPYVGAIDIAASDASGGLLTEQKWKVLCRSKVKLLPKQMAAVHTLMAYFSLVDDSGMVNLTELLALLKTVVLPSSSTAQDTASPNTMKAPAESPAERLKNLLTRAKEQGVDLQSSFGHFDTDGSGEVTRKELRRGLVALGIFNDMDERELDALLGQLDSDASGKISFREFSALVQGEDKSAASKASDAAVAIRDEALAKLQSLIATAVDKGVSVESCFRHFDKNADGKISPTEFAASMVELGLATTEQRALLDEVTKLLDRDGSGQVDLAEFKQLFPSGSPDQQKEATPSHDRDEQAGVSSTPAVSTDRHVSGPTETLDRLRALLLAAQAGGVDVQASFAHFDSDGDGSISSAEFVASLQQLPGFEAVPEEEIRDAVVAALDTNGSRSISLSEFRAFLSRSSVVQSRGSEEKEPSPPSEDALASESKQGAAVTDIAAGNTATRKEDSEGNKEASESAAAATGAQGDGQEKLLATREPGTSHSDEAPPMSSSAETPRTSSPAGTLTDGAEHEEGTEDDGVKANEADATGKPTTKLKPPMARAGSFNGAARGKPRVGARPSLTATRRARTDPESIQAAADHAQTAENSPVERSPAETLASGQAEQGGEAAAGKPTARAKPARRPSFASARAAASRKAAATDATATASEDASKDSAQSVKALSPDATAVAAAVPAEVASSIARLRALLVAAQASGVDVHKSFGHFDKDGSGQLKHDEFASGLRELGDDFRALSDAHVAEVTRALDREARGHILVQDLVAFVNTNASDSQAASPAQATSASTAAVKESDSGSSVDLARAAETAAPASKTPQATRAPSTASTAAARRRSSVSSSASKPPPGMAQRRASSSSNVPTAKPPSEPSASRDGAASGAVDAVSQQPESSVSAAGAESTPLSSRTASPAPPPTTPSIDDCAYAFHPDPEVRAVELKLRRAAVDAYSRGVLPLRLLSKFLDDNVRDPGRPRPSTGGTKRQRKELLRVEFLQVLMELGFRLQSDRDDADERSSGSQRGRYSGCATRMNDHLYARQLERLARYRRHTRAAKEDARAQRQLVRAAARPTQAASREDAASLQRFDEDKAQLLRVLSYYRDGHKKGLVYSLLREQVTTSLRLFPRFAELLFLELPFRNPYNHGERFRVELLLPADAERARALVDVDVVRSSAEWRFYRRHLPLAFPVGGDAGLEGDDDDHVESEMMDGQNELVMDAHDALRIPLRLRWLDASASASAQSARARSLFPRQRQPHEHEHEGGDEDGEDDGQRVVPVSVMVKSCSHGHTVALFKLSLRPQPLVCHRVLRFSHPAGSIWRWRLRCPRGAFLVCTDPRVAVEASSQGGGADDVDGAEEAVVALKCRVGEYPSLEQFHVVLYGDRYLAKVLETWQVRVQARLRVDARAVAGQRVTSELVVRTPDDEGAAGSRRLVQCFARARDASTTQFRPGRVFQLAPRAFNRIELAYCSVGGAGMAAATSGGPAAAAAAAAAVETDVVLVNLVDVERRELVGAWSVRVTLAPPRVTKTFALQVPARAGAMKKIAYANPWDVPQVIALRSSCGARMAPRERELQVPAHGRAFLRLAFSPCDLSRGAADRAVYLFINDKPTDENEECLLFHVTYV